ncbi:sigma-70 family RNA polymerase sigma factor [Brevibacillus ginsengisoli]|uniref:sigma-70 family RNA polymerase sigma factor n=1 Tax=Brevibacillus ginsengisoli TaxID=363854 RepID=UPI003CEABF34
MEGLARMREEPQSAAEDFQTIFRTHYPQVVRYIMRFVHEQTIAEDIAQDVFLKLYAANLSEIENISAWLIKTAITTTYNQLRQEKRRVLREAKDFEADHQVIVSTEEKWLHLDEIEEVRAVLHELSERDRLLLLMKYSGYNYQELARAAEVESSSIGTLLVRAKKRFREYYQRIRGQE